VLASCPQRLSGFQRMPSTGGVLLTLFFLFMAFLRVDAWASAEIDEEVFYASPHGELSCEECHPERGNGPGYPEERGYSEESVTPCYSCHLTQNEKVVHDAHRRIACQACHLRHVTPVRNSNDARVGWRKNVFVGGASRIHEMADLKNETACRRCHYRGNRLGAAAMVLPAKSILCAMCHPASFSVGDATTIIALGLFILGIIYSGFIWFSGAPGRDAQRSGSAVARFVLPKRVMAAISALIMDALLVRRLFQLSKTRWLIHGLIYYPILFRFIWGALGVGASYLIPQWPGTWIMLDKYQPANAFLFDLTGLLMVVGIVLIIARKYLPTPEPRPAGLASKSWWGAGLLGGIIIVGFVLEGMGIAMRDTPDGISYAFIGGALSGLFPGADLTGIYGYVWHVHAALTGAFLVCLPFGNMFHMLMAPLTLALGVAAQHPAEATNFDVKGKLL
jgi:hypothetical protein